MQSVYNYLINWLSMAKFKITKTTTVAKLKEWFRDEFGGTLRVYEGRSEATEDATLVSIGGKVGELECRASRTVGKFEEAFQTELGLKVKVYPKDNNVSVLDGITLSKVKDIPNMSTHAKMEQFLSYKREEESSSEDVTEEDTQEEYILFVSERDGIDVNSQDNTKALVLKKGENKVYLKEYPFLKDGFILDGLNGCKIVGIDFSHVSMLKIKTMKQMFCGVRLEKLDLTHLDTSEVTYVNDAFAYAKIDTIDMSGLDLSKIDDPKWCGMFNQNFGINTIILNGCNAKTVKNIKAASDGGSTIISDLDTSNSSDYEILTKEKFEEASNGNIIVVLEKLDVTNADELSERMEGEDACAIITRIDGVFHYVGNDLTDKETLEETEINYDELYVIFDYVKELNNLSFDNIETGIYLPESSYSYYCGDDDVCEWPDEYVCNVIAEALTGDNVVRYDVTFDEEKFFVCNGEIIARCY